MDGFESISDLLDSLNNSIEDIHEHPTKIDKVPSNLEIMVRGVSDSKGLDLLFSPKVDSVISGLFQKIENMDFDTIIQNKDNIENLMNGIFGEGSFKGPVSTMVLNTIQSSVQSGRYQTMKNHLGKTMTTLKKINLVLKNLERGKKAFKKDPELLAKYKDAVYAIKHVLKFAARVYRNRKIINRKVFEGINNIVHEGIEPFSNYTFEDEALA